MTVGVVIGVADLILPETNIGEVGRAHREKITFKRKLNFVLKLWSRYLAYISLSLDLVGTLFCMPIYADRAVQFKRIDPYHPMATLSDAAATLAVSF